MKALLLALVAASVRASATNSTTPFDSIEQPHAGYIIELEPAAAHSKRDTHVLFHRSAQNSANYSVRHEFTNSEYFYGLSVDASEEDASILAEMPGVKNIWPNRVHARPSPYRGTTVIDGNKLSRRGNTAKAEKVTVAHVTGDSDVHSALKMANVDKVHKLGFTGKGVKIGIIDSGIDYRHPALGGGFGPGFKVAGGYDLVGENYTGQNKPVPDSDPLATCLEGGHGTHVAGIIGARDPKDVGFGLLGVAPDATLYAYRIFSCTGSAADDVIMQGFEKAASDGVDLISMSAGYSNIWETNSPYAPLMKSLRDKNIGLIIAAGNDGERGPYFASTPALTQSVIAVGSVANTKFTTIYRAKDSAGQTVEYARIIPISDSKNKFNVFTVPTEESGCTAEDFKKAASAFPNKDRVIAVLSRNSFCLNDDNMAAAGIKEVWIEGKEGVDIRIEEPGRFPGYTVSEITPADGKKIRDAIAKQGANYTVTFSDQSVHDTKQGDAGLMNIFSTMGPTMEMSLKPQISAPGGNILSTWAAEGGIGYAVISGTSMSTPFLSGVYALIKSSNPKLTTNDIRRRIQNSASQVVAATKRDVLAPASYQGAGLVDALKAVNTKFTATPAELSLRDSSKPKAQTITIENKANVAKTYTLSHKGAAIIYALPNIFSTNHNQKFRWSFDNDVYAASYATAKFSSTTVKVAANSKATFQVTIQPPTDFDVNKLPVYSGFITITADDKESVSVPYVGVPYERNSVPVLDTTNLTDAGYWSPGPPKGVPTIPLMMNQDNSVRNNDIGTYKFKNGDLPGLFISIRQPSAYVRLDVVPVDTPFKPDFYGFDTTKVPKFNKPKLDVTKLDNIANVTSYGAIEITHGDPSLPSAGKLGRLWRGWGAYTSTWQTPSVTLNNGTAYQLPNADYRLLLRVLKWGQDYRNPESYESWLSPIARVQYTK